MGKIKIFTMKISIFDFTPAGRFLTLIIETKIGNCPDVLDRRLSILEILRERTKTVTDSNPDSDTKIEMSSLKKSGYSEPTVQTYAPRRRSSRNPMRQKMRLAKQNWQFADLRNFLF